MKQVLSPLSVIALFALTASIPSACKTKPSETACREAVENIRRINGQSANEIGTNPETAIRSCRGSSTKKIVECMRLAKTSEDLLRCEDKEATTSKGSKDSAPPDKATGDKSK